MPQLDEEEYSLIQMKDSTDCKQSASPDPLKLLHPPSSNQGLSRAEDITVDNNSDHDSSKNSAMHSEPENSHNIKPYTSNETLHVSVKLQICGMLHHNFDMNNSCYHFDQELTNITCRTRECHPRTKNGKILL
jgi:hypothetical protein